MSKRQRRRTEKRRRHQLATGAGITVGATLLMGGAAQAACTCTVNSLLDTADPGHTTLRDAITSANLNSASTITFASGLSGDTITLGGSELPQITAYSTTIQGPSGGITVDANHASRVFNVAASDARIAGLTIQHGTETYGGGIYLQAGNLTVANSVVTGNKAETINGNGGGIFVKGGNLTVDSSTISDNDSELLGGGIGMDGNLASGAASATVRNSTLSGNTALDHGGGAYFSFKNPATVQNSTVYDNYAGDSGGGLYHFGRNGGPGLIVTGSTITTNYGDDRGGGVAGSDLTGYTPPAIRDSIVAENTTGTGPGSDISALTATMDVGFSLIGDPDPDTTINPTGPNLIGLAPQLGALTNNGGSTETQKPAPTSPVVDAGSAFGLTSDQRGQARPFDAITANAVGGDASDIGAVELQVSDIAAPPGPPTTTPPAPTAPGVTKKQCKKKKHKRSAESAKKKCKKKKKKR
jgi:hypothetical protein